MKRWKGKYDELSGNVLGQRSETLLLVTLVDEDGSFALLRRRIGMTSAIGNGLCPDGFGSGTVKEFSLAIFLVLEQRGYLTRCQSRGC